MLLSYLDPMAPTTNPIFVIATQAMSWDAAYIKNRSYRTDASVDQNAIDASMATYQW